MADTEGVSRTTSQLANLRDLHHQDLAQRHSTLSAEHDKLQKRLEKVRATLGKREVFSAYSQHDEYAVMLVDGNHWKLDAAQAGGGRRASRLLHQAMQSSLRIRGLEHFKTVIRIYASLSNMTKFICSAGLIQSDALALGSVVAAFNSAHGLNEFIDAGDSLQDTPPKLRTGALGIGISNTSAPTAK